MMIDKQLTVLVIAIGATAVAAMLLRLLKSPLFMEQRDRREKARAKLKDQIRKKLQGGIKLEAHEIADIGRGLGLSSSQSINALYELYSEADNQDQHTYFKTLLSEINREEPFESLPEEVRPSLARLSFICKETSQDSDKELLHPINKILGEYQEMKRNKIGEIK